MITEKNLEIILESEEEIKNRKLKKSLNKKRVSSEKKYYYYTCFTLLLFMSILCVGWLLLTNRISQPIGYSVMLILALINLIISKKYRDSL